MSKRRGRPPLNRPAIDLGTPELVHKRALMAGPPRVTTGSDGKNKKVEPDMTMTTRPIDVLKENGTISEEAHQAAERFAALRKKIFGKASPGAIDIGAVSRGRPDEDDDTAEAEAKYREACLAIKHYSRSVFDAVENLVIHDRWPRWMFELNADRADREKATLGLAALLAWHKNTARKKAA